MARLEIGAKAPAFTLTNQSGKKISSKDLLGKRYVLYFYPQDDTPGCTREACQFNDELSGFKKQKVTVLGVSPDDAASHVAFRKKFGLTFDLLSDPDKKTMEKFGAYGEKMMYGKKTIGIIRSTFVIGPTGKVEQAMYGVKTDGHAARVLGSLEN